MLLAAARAAVLAAVATLVGGAATPNSHGCVTEVARKLPYCDRTLSVDARLDDLLSRFSLEEKIAQITPQPDLAGPCTTVTRGKADIGLPEWLWLVETNTNVASGCPKEGHCATTFVGPLGMGASFNRTSWRLKGSVLGTEMRALNNIGGSRFKPDAKRPVSLTAFGPNINIARDPRFGRNSELPGEDPFLSGSYAFEMVSGMQEKDARGYPKVAAYLKHFTAYSTEANRGHDSYNISLFDFFDTYLPQYRRAFAAEPAGVMCSYNAENGRPSCANDWLLNKQLRSWKPDAMVTTDCGVVNNLKGEPVNAPDDAHAAAYALMNGTDLEMGTTLFNSLGAAIVQGLATEARVDEAVRRSLKVHFALGRFDPPEATEWSKFGLEALNSTLHQQISYEAALQSLVLLKNDGGALPLRRGTTVAVLGPQAVARYGLLPDYAADQWCYNGTDDCIGTIAEAIAAANVGGTTTWKQGVDVCSNRTDGIQAALDAAQAVDAVVLALGIDRSIEHEGLDRTDTALPGLQEAFAKQVLALGLPTVLVLTGGGALAIDGLVSRASSQASSGSPAPYAIVEAFSPSVLGGRAIAASLFGLQNRWGKLPITMYPHSFIQEQAMTNYDMTVAPGRTYKYYKGTPLFSFGFGLSLTTFEHTCLPPVPQGEAGYSLRCSLRNTGRLPGDEVLQVYHRAADVGAVGHPLPQRALVDFARVSLEAGGSANVAFELPADVLKVVNGQGERTLYPGWHELIVSRGRPEDEQVMLVPAPPVLVV